MKRIFIALATLALLVPAGRQANARTDISIDFFYDNLSDGGSWVDVADYGYCWQPAVAVSNRTWRPYSDGYWAYTDVGWTWVSYEDFGWATYHYGRWIRLRGRGWVWMPGRDWGPAWVSWRTGGDYVGWAPLPPRRAGDIFADFSPINSQVDIDFDIGPATYNFIDVRYIGEPVLRERIFAADQNVTYITKTVNVTNITYTNSTVYNYGPDYNTLSRYSTRPIQRLSLQRETTVDPATAARSKSLMRVQGDKLVVAAPQQFQKPAKTVAPKVVKEKIKEASVEHGWEPVADKKAQADLKAKMQKEDPKSVPPPTIQSEKSEANPASTAPASPITNAPPSPVSPGTTPATTPEKNKNKRNEKPGPSPKAPKEKTEKRKNELDAAAPPMPMPMQNNPPRLTPPPVTKPESVEKSKPDAPADNAPKMKKESPQERAAASPTSPSP